jgi:hypothetical protein
MEKHYHAHLIRFAGNRDPESSQWTPTLSVIWSEGGETISRQIIFKSTFTTEADAQVRAFDFAVNWIDAGKPEIAVG